MTATTAPLPEGILDAEARRAKRAIASAAGVALADFATAAYEALESWEPTHVLAGVPVVRVLGALHALHEQAHGGTFTLCQAYPCNELGLTREHTAGPAPLVLPNCDDPDCDDL